MTMFCVVFITDPPSEPRNLTVTDVQADSVALQWSPPETTGGIDLLGYVVERREVGRQQWARVGQTNPDVTTIKARNLLEGRPYTFRVMAENLEGLSEPATMLKPITPERPIGEVLFACVCALILLF
jgi:titin